VYVNKVNHYSWLQRKADGTARAIGDWGFLLTPLIHVMLGGFALSFMHVDHIEITLFSFLLAYALAAVSVGAMVLIVIVLFATIENFGNWWDSLVVSISPNKWDELLCSTAPAEGLRDVGYTPRLLYQRVVGAFCKPVAS